MRKFILCFLCVALSGFAFSAEKLQILFDYSEGQYVGRSLEAIRQYEPDFDKDRIRYEGKFLESFDEKYKKLYEVVEKANPDLPCLTVKILKVVRNGNTTADLIFSAPNKDAVTKHVKAKGGTFGTFLNLFGDGMGSLGEIAGKNCKKLNK